MLGEELLDTLREDVLRDTSVPPLWSDRRLVQCLNEAYLEFAELTYIIRDSSSDVARIALEEGVTQYPLSESVVSVLSARYQDDARNLLRGGENELHGAPMVSSDAQSWLTAINSGNGVLPGGPPRMFTSDDSNNTITFSPAPTAAEAGKQVFLRVARLPTDLLDEDDLSRAVELPRQFVLALVYGAAAIAYGDQDADGNDPERAQRNRARFMEYVDRCKAHVRRQMFQPITFGFGPGGFAHSR